MNKFVFFLALFLIITEYSYSKEKYKIGFSQCTSADMWRKAMHREMIIELAFHPDLELTIKDAGDSNRNQISDIQEFLNEGIDLLIVSPNESDPVTPIVEEVFNSGIPVIVIDRNISSDAYTAYIGSDNYLIGKEAGSYAAKLLEGRGTIIEIRGLDGSSPAIDRSNGFRTSLQNYPDIEIVTSPSGKWNYSDSKVVMQNMIDENIDFDLVFAHNDVMAIAAHEICKKNQVSNKFFLGIDGLYGKDGGTEAVIEGKLNATFLYRTGGEEAIQIAHKILNGLPFDRENILETVVIDSNNAKILKLQTEQVQNLQGKIESQNDILDRQISKFNDQRTLLIVVLFLLGAIFILVVIIFRAFRNKKQANIKLEQQKKEIEKRNSEIIKQRDQIIEVSEKLKNATQTKLRFFTNISHEFRTPLTLIVGPLENMIHSKKIPVEFQNQINMMYRNSLRLLRMINQLMDFRKIENAKMKLHAGRYDLVSFVKEIQLSFTNLAENKKITLDFASTETEIQVWFDWDKLDKVIFNLLSNAFKFTPENGRISIQIKKTKPVVETIWQEEVVIEVRDNGKGISGKHLSRIFDRFYQVEKSQDFKGTGLGLSLSKEFIELHHGKIKVESTERKGTTFTIHLPLGDTHLTSEEKIETKLDSKPDTHEKPISDEIYIDQDQPSKVTTINLGHAAKPLILLVEDEKDVRTYVKESLKEHYTILEAKNGKEALSIIEEEEPDLIVSDIMMPEMDGLELTRTIKSDLKTCHIPVILLTAKASLEQKFEGLEEGADSYIPKPFNSKHLQIRVKKLLEIRKKMHERYKGQLFIEVDDDQISRMDRKFLNKVSNIVEQHLDKEELSVEELSQLIGLSRVHVYRKIKKLTGMSVSEFVRSVKLKQSLNLIKTSGKSISEIAYEVGFSSPSYFTRCFKKQFGISPSEFAKN
ncbi:substrate-binding domain-containing protein [Prolixibacteraceae bacterium Z1-6]|uniref:histidine kinase n=1 Tax=Draconibacterium aestuarii TaxID=2998507 RepID=A0A9X3J5G7_9BACT|nr:substrate-binding domain-containing protein [Prolixibacteraceae bacterium Z1-6]